MAEFSLMHLGRNVIRLPQGAQVTITSTSDEPAEVFIDYKDGGAWHPFSGRVSLPGRGAHWTASQAELGCDQIRVVARGKDDTRPIVRVEY